MALIVNISEFYLALTNKMGTLNMTQKIYRLNGDYFGFIWQARLFDKNSNYVGWFDGKEVWTTENEYLGGLLDGKHIVKYAKRKVFHNSKANALLQLNLQY